MYMLKKPLLKYRQKAIIEIYITKKGFIKFYTVSEKCRLVFRGKSIILGIGRINFKEYQRWDVFPHLLIGWQAYRGDQVHRKNSPK